MTDYYEVLGASPEASRDELKAAYRKRRDEFKAGAETSQERWSELNRAWNTLSDPYQRARYDDERIDGRAPEADDVATNGNGSPVPSGHGGVDEPPRPGLFGGGRRDRPGLEPTITVPEGMALVERRPRLFALLFDLTAIFLIVWTVFAVGEQVIQDRHPETFDQLDVLRDEFDEVVDERDAAREADDEAAEEAAEDRLDEIRDERSALASDIEGDYLVRFVVTFLAVLVYLVPSSARRGQTLGKWLRGVRVVQVDGAPIGWGGAFRRYGLLVLFVVVVSQLLGEMALLLALFGVLTWLGNPNRQGLHDRVARTIVVEADRPGRR